MADYIKEEQIKKTKEELKVEYPELFIKDLFDMITVRELNKKIVGEIESRQTIFLCAMGCKVDNAQIASYNLSVDDKSGVGKDYITNATLEILPEYIRIKRTRISPTVALSIN